MATKAGASEDYELCELFDLGALDRDIDLDAILNDLDSDKNAPIPIQDLPLTNWEKEPPQGEKQCPLCTYLPEGNDAHWWQTFKDHCFTGVPYHLGKRSTVPETAVAVRACLQNFITSAPKGSTECGLPLEVRLPIVIEYSTMISKGMVEVKFLVNHWASEKLLVSVYGVLGKPSPMIFSTKIKSTLIRKGVFPRTWQHKGKLSKCISAYLSCTPYASEGELYIHGHYLSPRTRTNVWRF